MPRGHEISHRRRTVVAMATGALLASFAGVALWTSPAFTSHRVCSVNGLNSIFQSQASASSNAVDINVECNNVDLRTRTGPEVQGTATIEPNAPGFDPSQLLAFAALDRCIGPLTGSANLESGLGAAADSDCQTKGGVVMHGPFSALGPGAVTNNMFGRIITVNGFDAVSFLKADSGDAIAFGNNNSADVIAMQGIVVPCTNPLQSLHTGLFTCDIALLGGNSAFSGAGGESIHGRGSDGLLQSQVTLGSFNMAPNTSSAFTISPAVTVGTGGNSFLVSTNNDFQFINAGGTAPTSNSICQTVVDLNGGAVGKGAATALSTISSFITVNTGVSCGIQRITQNVPNATGVEDPTGTGGAGGGVSLVSMVFSWFTQQQLGNLALLSQAGAITTAATDPRVNFIQLISQGAFNLDANGFFRYNAGGTTFPVASYPTGRTMSLGSLISGPAAGDAAACIPATPTNSCAP